VSFIYNTRKRRFRRLEAAILRPPKSTGEGQSPKDVSFLKGEWIEKTTGGGSRKGEKPFKEGEGRLSHRSGEGSKATRKAKREKVRH